MATKTFLFLLTVALGGTPAQPPRFHLRSGDERDYVEPVENLLRIGMHTLDPSDPLASVYRMPGYSVTLLPLRILFGPDWGVNAQVAYQVVMGGIAAYAAAMIALSLTRSTTAFLITLAFATLSMTASVFDAYILADGLASSVLAIVVWLLIQVTPRARRLIGLVAVGTLFTYAVFLRPFLAPLGVVFALHIIRYFEARRLLALCCFLAVPTLAESAWVGRNWLLTGRLIPFQTAGYELHFLERAVRHWIISFGGDYVWWRPGTVHAWLLQHPHFAPTEPPIPARVYAGACTSERLDSMAGLYRKALAAGDGSRRLALEAEVAAAFDSCREIYEAIEPLDHHVIARLRLLRTFLVHSGNVLMLTRFEDLRWPSWVARLKVWAAASYAVIGLTAVPGVLLLLKDHRRRGTLLVAAVPLYIVTLFPLVLRYVETRWLAHAWPFLCVAAGLTAARGGEAWRAARARSAARV